MESKEPGLDVTAVTRLKHADLYEAAKQIGSQSATARYLGVSVWEFHKWCNLRSAPPRKPTRHWPVERLEELEKKLFELTGKLIADLFPRDLYDDIRFQNAPKKIEKTQRIQRAALENYATTTAARLGYDGVRAVDEADMAEARENAINKALGTLSYRERNIIKLRFYEGYTLEEVGHIFKVTGSRIREIEAKAIRKLQQRSRSADLLPFVEELGGDEGGE